MRYILIIFALLMVSCTNQAPHHHITEKKYFVRGHYYYPQTSYKYNRVGYASWYGGSDHGKKTATGKYFNKYQMTAAHRTLPLPSVVKVTNLENGKSVILVVNDRGPFAETSKRIIDVSEAAAEKLGFKHKGTAKVRVECLEEKSVIAALNYGKKPYATPTSHAIKVVKKIQKSKNK